MAAFIYLDLYFSMNEPHNPAFAHNFIIFAPSGLKSSVVPSLKTIQRFDPAWVIPEPAASSIKRMLSFEVLDQGKTASKSNKTKNPNVQKIANHQPLSELFGLVAVTNAEKVILDRIEEKNGQISMYEESDDEKDRQANELRNLIGKLPSLSIFIDEVHHAVSDEIKLRAVVNRWTEGGMVNSVSGFSGTPYLEKAEKITVRPKIWRYCKWAWKSPEDLQKCNLRAVSRLMKFFGAAAPKYRRFAPVKGGFGVKTVSKVIPILQKIW